MQNWGATFQGSRGGLLPLRTRKSLKCYSFGCSSCLRLLDLLTRSLQLLFPFLFLPSQVGSLVKTTESSKMDPRSKSSLPPFPGFVTGRVLVFLSVRARICQRSLGSCNCSRVWSCFSASLQYRLILKRIEVGYSLCKQISKENSLTMNNNPAVLQISLPSPKKHKPEASIPRPDLDEMKKKTEIIKEYSDALYLVARKKKEVEELEAKIRKIESTYPEVRNIKNFLKKDHKKDSKPVDSKSVPISPVELPPVPSQVSSPVPLSFQNLMELGSVYPVRPDPPNEEIPDRKSVV